MNSTKAAVAIGTIIVLIAGAIVTVKWKHTRAAALETAQTAKITVAVERIKEANTGLPDLQAQAKALIFTAMIQKQIPAASKWCEKLNVDGKLWPATPTNTVFAMNSLAAGRAYSKTSRLPGDVVVFFETLNPGWNLTGGPESLANRDSGVTVAFADGRAMVVMPSEAANLRWTP